MSEFVVLIQQGFRHMFGIKSSNHHITIFTALVDSSMNIRILIEQVHVANTVLQPSVWEYFQTRCKIMQRNPKITQAVHCGSAIHVWMNPALRFQFHYSQGFQFDTQILEQLFTQFWQFAVACDC